MPEGNAINIGDNVQRDFTLLDYDDEQVAPTLAAALTEEPDGSSVSASVAAAPEASDYDYRLTVGPFTHRGLHVVRITAAGSAVGVEDTRIMVQD